jgi:hypothetical protein
VVAKHKSESRRQSLMGNHPMRAEDNMTTIAQAIELAVRIPSEPAAMGQVMAATVCSGAEVLATHSYADGTGATVLLITKDAPRVTLALEAHGFTCRATSIVVVATPNQPGLTAQLGMKMIAAGIGVLYSYMLSSARGQSYAVFKTTDDKRAAYLLGIEDLVHGLAEAKSFRHATLRTAAKLEAVQEAA